MMTSKANNPSSAEMLQEEESQRWLPKPPGGITRGVGEGIDTPAKRGRRPALQRQTRFAVLDESLHTFKKQISPPCQWLNSVKV